MTFELTPQQIDELLPAYVLGALEPEEMIAMDDYIQRQRELLSNLESLEGTVAQLAHAAPSAPLPTHNRSRLMHRVASDLSQREALVSPAPVKEVRPSFPEQLRRLFRSPLLAGAALVALLLMLPYGWFTQQRVAQLVRSEVEMAQQVDTLSSELDTLRADQARLQQVNQRLEQQLQGQQGQLAFFTTVPEVIEVPGTDEAPGASGVFYEHDGEGLFVWSGLEALPEESAYQLWLIPDGSDPVSAGMLDGTNGATAAIDVPIPASLRDYAAIGVTIEPSGGSASPTGPLVLLGDAG